MKEGKKEQISDRQTDRKKDYVERSQTTQALPLIKALQPNHTSGAIQDWKVPVIKHRAGH